MTKHYVVIGKNAHNLYKQVAKDPSAIEKDHFEHDSQKPGAAPRRLVVNQENEFLFLDQIPEKRNAEVISHFMTNAVTVFLCPLKNSSEYENEANKAYLAACKFAESKPCADLRVFKAAATSDCNFENLEKNSAKFNGVVLSQNPASQFKAAPVVESKSRWSGMVRLRVLGLKTH